ncbi:hypothetical protein [Streptomyces sp. CBMA152]|uniref:hypothetical protein n=1 Tax=Streptomyces sp. CBMA152 TaxID=1896312 RepID=UPI001CB6FF9D|nr:hypothetical protein [Streptomyces sp. CBMA152]
MTGTRYPDSGVKPLPTMEVRAALLALNTNAPDLRFRVRHGIPEERADVVAEFQIPQLNVALKTRMRLVPADREVRVLEERWEDSPEHSGRQHGRGHAPAVYRQWSYERGADGHRHKVETFRFDTREMRDPLVKVALDAGWTWRGVIFRW